ncbi:MAG: RNA 2',3'-cyclic phosphodiesterase [Thermoplasmata archaeon]|nr:RNA 2',3'-cyclic phosphodiesterase [Thermoplasmata archaeon]
MRLFIAVKIPWASGFDGVVSDVSRCPLKVKWVEKENTHVTLKFLGEVSEAFVPEIEEALSGALEDVVSGAVVLKGIGGFPNLRRPRVIWVGIEDSGVLRELYRRVEEAMVGVGFKREKKSFKPHLTLGRVKRVLSNPLVCMEDVGKRWGEEEFMRLKVDEVHLIQSILSSTGPTYLTIKSYRLRDQGVDG